MVSPSRVGPYCSRACFRSRPRILVSHADGTVGIPLYGAGDTIRGYATVDADDVDFVNQWRWHLGNDGYATRSENDRNGKRSFSIHRELLGLARGDGLEGDHINRNRLDNRRSNLRVLPKKGRPNAQNVTVPRGSSKYRGVTWHKQAKKWRATVCVNGQLRSLGCFSDEDEAGRVAKEARLRLLPYATD
jgi:hypothetical protein